MNSQHAGIVGLDRFVLAQLETETTERYEVRAVGAGGEPGPVIVAAQPRSRLRDKVVFFADGNRSQPSFWFTPATGTAGREAFDVFDAGGRPIGRFHKELSGRDATWHLETDGIRARAEERSPGMLARIGVGAKRTALDFLDRDGRCVLTTEPCRGAQDSCLVAVPEGRLDTRVAASWAVAYGLMRAAR